MQKLKKLGKNASPHNQTNSNSGKMTDQEYAALFADTDDIYKKYFKVKEVDGKFPPEQLELCILIVENKHWMSKIPLLCNFKVATSSYHAALVIGSQAFHWFDSSLVHVEETASQNPRSVLLCLRLGSIPQKDAETKLKKVSCFSFQF